jgi:hypothetical protein
MTHHAQLHSLLRQERLSVTLPSSPVCAVSTSGSAAAAVAALRCVAAAVETEAGESTQSTGLQPVNKLRKGL